MAENAISGTRKGSRLFWCVLIAVIAVAAFANSLGGEFVYDDKRQLAGNVLIQDDRLIGKALVSDVWAFKGDGSIAASNYWRPTFTAWSILNFKLFGVEPFGWHLLNILLHAGVCILAFMLLRRWDVSEAVAFCISVIFAVHPVHVESVAWISGSPDLLFSIFILASLWFATDAAEEPGKKFSLVISAAFYAVALGAKEIAILGVPLYYLIFSGKSPAIEDEKTKLTVGSNRLHFTGIFVGIAAAYFAVRWMILGTVSQPAEGAVHFQSAILSAPSIFVFYLGQIFFPINLGPNYSLRPIEMASFSNFVLPLLISGVIVAASIILARRSFVRAFGFLLFILFLLPVFNITAFPPEQIVHDRYLYLPLLGLLILLVPSLKNLLAKKYAESRANNILYVFCLMIGLALAIQTFNYNRVWNNEISLWQHSVKIDPSSAFNWMQLGSVLSEKDRVGEAVTAFEKSIAIRPNANARVGRARNLIQKGDLDPAIADLRLVLEIPAEEINAYTLFQAYEAISLAYQQAGKLAEAERELKEARIRLPIYRAALTEKLSVVLYLQNKKNEALAELESAQIQARVEMLPTSKSVFFRLAMLNAERGNRDSARNNLLEYLELTKSSGDALIVAERTQAVDLLRKLR